MRDECTYNEIIPLRKRAPSIVLYRAYKITRTRYQVNMPKYKLICGRYNSNFNNEKELVEHLNTFIVVHLDPISGNVNVQIPTNFFSKCALAPVIGGKMAAITDYNR
ncbi:unnamed protein product [Adineta ricciae]|uniref:Uncharacterized protein n=1 Tax=Adineta ricciae TaxID=249248 RepID=A0A815GYK6_ADIRI|nr:unnamed protein product [Adineta ricciae]